MHCRRRVSGRRVLLNRKTLTMVCLLLHSYSCDVKFVRERGVARLSEVARCDFLLTTRPSQMNAEAAKDVDPKY